MKRELPVFIDKKSSPANPQKAVLPQRPFVPSIRLNPFVTETVAKE